GFEVLGFEACPSYIFQADQVRSVVDKDHVIELLFRFHVAGGTDTEFGIASDQFARRQLYVLTVKRVPDIKGREAVRRKLSRIEPQTHGISLFSPDPYLADPLDRLKPLGQYVLTKIRDLKMSPGIALYGHCNNGARAGICLGDRRKAVDVIG